MIALGWIALLAGSLALMLYASTRTVGHVRVLAEGSRMPPFLIGITLIAIGTDLPEIANSLVSSFSGHGDLNAGDSIGSTVTQATLVLGLMPILIGSFLFARSRMFLVCGATIAALGLGAYLMQDGFISRVDGAILLSAWLVGSIVIWRGVPESNRETRSLSRRRIVYHGAAALAALVVVGVAASGVVISFVRLSAQLGAPEYLLSFFVASVGTSLPEAVVDLKVLRQGQHEMAMGAVLGSSFVDATLSIGIGPALFPTAVTGSLAVEGSLTAIAAIGLVALILAPLRRHTRRSGAALLLLYLGVYVVLLT